MKNKNKYKFIATMLGTQLIAISAINLINGDLFYVYESKAIEKSSMNKNIMGQDVIRYKVLEKYGFGESYNSEFATYLKKKGVNDSEYRQYISDAKKYRGSSEEKIYEAEQLMSVFDTVLYTNSTARNIYEINKKNVKDKDKAWSMMKKACIYDIAWLEQVYKESFSSADMEEVYKYTFKKKPSEAIVKDLKSTSTLKYALYSGVLGRELTSEERSKIASGKGYELVGLSKSEYDKYLKFVNVRNKLNKHEETYIKEYYIHTNVRKNIKNKYGMDIFTKLSDQQRLVIYNASLVNLNYDDKIAQSHIENYIAILNGKDNTDTPAENIGGTGNGSIFSPLTPEKKPQVLKPITENNLNSDGYYGEFGKDWKALSNSEMNKLTVQHYYNGKYQLDSNQVIKKKKNYYYVRIEDETYITKVEVEKELNENMLITILEEAFEDTKWKVIESDEELLAFINNEIVIIDKEDSYNLKSLNKELKKIKVFIGQISQEQIDNLKQSKKLIEKEGDIRND